MNAGSHFIICRSCHFVSFGILFTYLGVLRTLKVLGYMPAVGLENAIEMLMVLRVSEILLCINSGDVLNFFFQFVKTAYKQ